MPNSPNFQKILIIQTAFIGDIALSVFFANDVRQLFPASEITFLSTPIGCELLQCFPFINRTIAFHKRTIHKGFSGIKAIAKQLNADAYDYVFVLHRSYRTAVLVQLLNAKIKIGFAANALSFILSQRIAYRSELHEVERNKLLLSGIADLTHLSGYHPLYINPTKPSEPYIAIAPGSVWATKRWLPEYFAELCKMLVNAGDAVTLIGAENEIGVCNYIASKANVPLTNLAGKTTISELLDVICHSQLLITNDSAPTHFASLCNTPTITIYGATTPQIGFAPLAEKSAIVEDTSVCCRPCGIHGRKKCPKKHFQCMQNITPDKVFFTVQSII
ncbi:MAG: glycosyltransferase family 9 protein [Ignavibacteria bacterium]|jgi:heptosyltransferase-2|nr:glycosyltransferase family 9 protein [Ignavibacteria bacterium]